MSDKAAGLVAAESLLPLVHEPLKGMPLEGMRLSDLILHDKQISDLSPLKGLPLTRLIIYNSGVSDLIPLQGMPLVEIRLNPRSITQGLDVLREIKSLKTIGIDDIQTWPPAEFWERYDQGEFTK